MRIRDFFPGRTQRLGPQSGDPFPALFEVLEPRLLLNAAYEVWGGNTDYTEAPGGWWNAALNVDKLGDYTKLGEANVTQTFNGTYNFYVVATRAQVPIDTVQGSDLSYVTTLTNSGNTSGVEFIGGSPDGYYGVVGTQYDWRNTFAGYIVIANPSGWNEVIPWNTLALGSGTQTGITVDVGTPLKPAVNVWISERVREQLPTGGPDENRFNFEVNEPGLVDSARFQAPTGLWYDLQRDSSDHNQLDLNEKDFDTLGALQAEFPDGTYTLEMTSSLLGTFTTPFSFGGMQPAQVPVVTTPTFAQSDVPTDVTVQWDPCTDPYVNNIDVEISDSNDNQAYHDWGLSPSATSSGPAALAPAQNYEVDVAFRDMYFNGPNADGYWYEAVKETVRELDIRTVGGGPVLPDLYVDAGVYTPGSYSPGDAFQLTISGGNNGPGNAFAFDALGNPIPIYAEIRLSRDMIWGNSDDVVLWQMGFGSMLGGPSSGGGMDLTLNIPAGVATGHYHVVGKIDSTDVVIETNEANNIMWSPMADVYIPGPESFVLTAPAAVTVAAGDMVPIQWTAGNVPAGSTAVFWYDQDTTWLNGNEQWLVAGVPVSEGTGSYSWDTTGVAPGTYYMAGFMDDGYGVLTFSEMTQSFTVVQRFQILAPPLPATANPGDIVQIQWNAWNVAPGATLSLCYDEDTVGSNGNEHWIVMDLPVGQGAGSYAWNTTGVAPGPYYIAGYLSGATPTDKLYGFGQPGDVPVFGDWNGDGKAEIGIYRNGAWALDYNGNGQWDGTVTDRVYYFGQAGDIPVVGDWDGSGTAKIGIYRNGVWALDYNGNGQWDGTLTDTVYYFGNPGDIPVVGDWDGSGTTKIGIVRQAGTNMCWAFDYNGNGQWDGTPTDVVGGFGMWGDVPIAGDWNGDGKDKVGIFRNGTPVAWALDYNGNLAWDGTSTDKVYVGFGASGDTPVVGDWNGDGKAEIGIYRTGTWALDSTGNGQWDWMTDATISQMTQPITFPFSISDIMPLTEGHHLWYSGQRDGAPVAEERYVIAPQVINGVDYQRVVWTRTIGGVTTAEIEYVTPNGLGYSLEERLGTNATGDYSVVFSDPLMRAPDSPVVGQSYFDSGSYTGQWLSGASAGFAWSGSVFRWTTVLDFEQITVGAGAFRAVKLAVTETQVEWWAGGWQTVTSTSAVWIVNGIGEVNTTANYIGSDSSGGSWSSSRSRQLTAYA